MLLFTILFCGFFGLLASRRKLFALPSPPWWIDLLVFITLAVAGCVYAFHLHHLINPIWNPFGRDWQDFTIRALEINGGGHLTKFFPASANRYLFYPWLGLQMAAMDGTVVSIGLMKVSIMAAGLLPAALYLMGRQFVPMPVALAGSLVVFNCPELLNLLGVPSEYILYTLFNVLCLGVGISALRSGGRIRFLGFGICLALLMVTDARALSVLLLAVPAGLAAVIWHGRRRPRKAASSMVLFVIPLVMGWYLGGRHDYELLSLESLVYISVRDQAHIAGREMAVPTGRGWTSNEASGGYWRVGDARALLNLPRTIKFFVNGMQGNIPLADRIQSHRSGLREMFPYVDWFLLLIIPGCLAAGSFRCRGKPARQWMVPWALAAGYATAFVAIMVLGMLSTVWISRYTLPLLVLLPTLLLAGVTALFRPLFSAPQRDAALYWWPLLLAVAWNVATANHSWSRQQVKGRIAHQAGILGSNEDHRFLMRIRQMEGRIGVVDLTYRGETPTLIPQHMLILPEEESFSVHVTQAHRRRFILEPCLPTPQEPHPHLVIPESDRLVRRSGCIYEDTTPGRPLILKSTFCTACPDYLTFHDDMGGAPAPR